MTKHKATLPAGPVGLVPTWLPWLLTLLLGLSPLLFCPYPPASDLPQHLAQVARAMEGELGQGQQVAWWELNNLVYLPMMAWWSLVGPHALAQATLIFLGAFWMGSHLWVAQRRGRPWEAGCLAALTYYNGIFYWGMLNYLLAWPLLLLWWTFFEGVVLRGPGRNFGRWFVVVLLSCLLAWAHILVLGLAIFLAICWLSLRLAPTPSEEGASRASQLKSGALALATFLPIFTLVLPWSIHLRASRQRSGFDVGAHWTTGPLQKAQFLLEQSFASAGSLSWLFGSLAMLWLLAALLGHRKGRSAHITAPQALDQRGQWDRSLLTLGVILLLLAFTLPNKFLNTIEFGTRWLPCAMGLLLLASPGPALGPRLRQGFVGALLLGFSVNMAVQLERYSQQELQGLELALSRIPKGSKVLGLDLLKTSETFPATRPFLHLSSYATVFHQASTNFDFARHGTALIRGHFAPTPWTPGIEWMAEWAKPQDLRHFNYALVGAPPSLQGRFPLARWMQPVTYSGKWRLYRLQ